MMALPAGPDQQRLASLKQTMQLKHRADRISAYLLVTLLCHLEALRTVAQQGLAGSHNLSVFPSHAADYFTKPLRECRTASLALRGPAR